MQQPTQHTTQHPQFKTLPIVDDSGRVTGTQRAIINQPQLDLDQAAAVQAAGLAYPAFPIAETTTAETDSNQLPSKQAMDDYRQAMQAYTAQADAIRAAIAPTYHLPAGCVDVTLPADADLANDIVTIKDGKATVQTGAAREARELAAKEQRVALEKAAAAQAQADQAAAKATAAHRKLVQSGLDKLAAAGKLTAAETVAWAVALGLAA